MMRATGRTAVLLLVLALAGCDWISGIFDDSASKKHLEGDRLSVLGLERRLEPDPALASAEVHLPQPVLNADWPQAGGRSNHVMQHLQFDGTLHRQWKTSVGDGASRYGEPLSQPVVAGGRVFAMDAEDVVVAIDATTGRQIWEADPKPGAAKDHTFGGGVAVAGDRVFVTTGYGLVLALEAATGKEIWHQQVAAPMRGPPTVSDNRLFAITVENRLEVLSTEDGHRLWTHSGLPETAGLVGAASPAVEGDIVVVPYSSGEIFALRVENGRPLWSDNLATARPLGALSTLADIRGRPVIDRGRVFALSHSGRMVAIDLRTGERVWEQEIGGTHGPWVVGDYVYVLGNDVDVFCLMREDGRVRWVHELPRFEDEKKKKDPIRWSGPILAGDRLIVVSSNGDGYSLSPYDGKQLGQISFSDPVFIEPVVAGDTLYVLTDEADLVALR
jgi:outer membrane protein assembly factor BamB